MATSTPSVTVYGVTITPPATLADDFEVIEQIAQVDAGDVSVTPELFRKVLGKKYDAVKKAIKKERGYVSTADMIGALVQVMEQLPKQAS